MIKESVKNILINEGMWDKAKGAFNGLRQGFNQGQEQMEADARRNNTNQDNSRDLTRRAMEAYKYLANCDHQDEYSMSQAISYAERELVFGLQQSVF